MMVIKGLYKYFTLVFFLFSLMLNFSCADDEKFSTNKSFLLSFSEDTVSFDTIISDIPSSTRRVLVFNKNSEGLRINSVRLGSNGTSGFRINVDGRKGPVVNDLEVLKKDSIFLLVELTTNQTNSNEPVYVSDSILFMLESGVQQKIILEAYGQDAIKLYAPVCESGDTVYFKSGLPYIIYDSLVVDSDAVLNIEAGATLMFHPNASLLVYGKLNVMGEEGKMVTIRGDRTDRLFPYLPYDRVDSQWGGIRFYSSSVNNVISYADIHGGTFGIVCDSTGMETEKLRIDNSIISNFNQNILFSNSNVIGVYNSILSNARYDCVNLIGGDYEFAHCTIAQFYAFHSRKGNALRVSNVNNLSPCNLYAQFDNCIITGFANDEILISPFRGNEEYDEDDIDLGLMFNNCLVTTDTTMVGQYFVDCFIDDLMGDINRKKHFKCVDTHSFVFDFHLDSLSIGCNNASSDYIDFLPKDMFGTQRNSGKIDIGALQR